MNESSARDDLLACMSDAAFYPHAVVSPIVVVETHISHVFLTGDYVYKIKKPLKLPFLDYSTLALRRHFCEEELRLNRRGAPEIYLEVVPLTLDGDRVGLGGSGPAVEYAVKMRQFPQESLLSNMLHSGKVDEALMELLARTVAEYHAGAETSGAIARFGTPERIRKVINDNYSQTQAYIGAPLSKAHFDQVRAFTEAFFQENGLLLDARAEGGYIRACHGDLHLRNICYRGGRISLFDCIEFNDAFRYVDVMHDVAFVVMDADAGGRSDLGTLFLNIYAERTGDWEGIQVLPLYLCRQAYVRGKVECLRMDEAPAGSPAREDARGSAARYFELAASYGRRRQGCLVLVCGVSGSGKSTVAGQLATRIGGIHIRSDAVRKHLAHVPLDQKGGEGLYSPEMTRRTYARLLELGMLLAAQGHPVVLDAKFDQRTWRREAATRAQAEGVPIHMIECIARPDLLRERLATRRGDVSDATPDLVEQQQNRFETLLEDERRFISVIDTSGRFDVSEIVRWVHRQRFGAPPAC